MMWLIWSATRNGVCASTVYDDDFRRRKVKESAVECFANDTRVSKMIASEKNKMQKDICIY